MSNGEIEDRALAKLVLEFDARWPGEATASMDLPAKEWARLVALAKAELSAKARA